MLDFPEKQSIVVNVQKAFEAAFEELKTNVYFKKILGYILALGNIMNGGTQRG